MAARLIDSQFRLQGWRADGALLLEDHADDLAALKSRAAGLWATSGYVRLDLCAWNLELNDWVRLERFEVED